MGKPTQLPRAVLIYLAVIVVPALVLLALGMHSVRRQQEAVATLAASNRSLAAEKLAAALDQRVRALATKALEQPLTPPFQPDHPVALDYFVLLNGAPLWPRLYSPPPRPVPGLPAGFLKAEELELGQSNPAQALDAYKRQYHLASAPEIKALILSRIVRCQMKLNDTAEASSTWRRILKDHPDVYDPSHRPYGLLAFLELKQHDELYRDLIRHRWELSAEQFDYYLDRLGRKPPAQNRFRLARELDEHFRHAGPLRDGDLYAYSLPGFGLYYRLSGPHIFGLASNTQWISGQLEPSVRAGLGLPADPGVESSRGLWIYAAGTLLMLILLVLGVVFVTRDVTREARMNQLRADFVSGVSHELKTPLTLIRLYAETLLRKEHPLEQRRGFYEIITRESERLSYLIQKVLSFSRIERGENEYSLEKGDLRETVGRTVQVYSQYLERSGFAVETGLADTLPAVRYDPDAVSQAVVNLLDNAVKYSGDRKFVAVRLHQVNGSVVFEVEDQGLGIPPDQHEKIFHRFYRAPNSSAKGGYGLGLFLVRHIMDAHSGKVELDSEQGRGSCFRLVFPVAS